MVSPDGAGGLSDILARACSRTTFRPQSWAEHRGREQRRRAAARIANDYVDKAPPDGYTLLHAAALIAIGEALYKGPAVRRAQELAAIAGT